MVFTKEQILGCFRVLHRLKRIQTERLIVIYDTTLKTWRPPSLQTSTNTDVFARMYTEITFPTKLIKISDELAASIKTMPQNDLDEIKANATILKEGKENTTNKTGWKMMPWLCSLLDAIASEEEKRREEEERNRQEKMLAFVMGKDPRLGENSPVRNIPSDTLEMIDQSTQRCARCSKYILD
jgi:hypothetical protein